MQKIPINLAQTGMVLAREVFQPGSTSTMAICGKGVVLTEGLIERMTRMDVKMLWVEGNTVRLPGETSLEEKLAHLDRRFKKIQDEPRMARIKEMFKRSFLIREKDNRGE